VGDAELGLDIYSYIPSIDIAEHCRTIGHAFTTLEMETRLFERFKTKDPNTVFTYLYSYTTDTDRHFGSLISHDANTPFSSYEKAVEAVRQHVKEEREREATTLNTMDFYICKRVLDVEDEYLGVQVNHEGKIVGDYQFGYSSITSGFLPEGDEAVFHAFDEMKLFVPVPFQKGDILHGGDGRPFILTNDGFVQKEGCETKGHKLLVSSSNNEFIYSYSILESGCVYWDFNPSSLALEYFRHELKGLNRTLKQVSAHMKGKLQPDIMMNACDAIFWDERRRSLREDMHYTEEGLRLAGVDCGQNEKAKDV
jgi:hypothetical protein